MSNSPSATESVSPGALAGAGDAAAAAFAELAATLGEIESGYISADRGMSTSLERSAGRYLVANALQHGFQCWFECDPKRPIFHRWLSPTKKLLGDNPDAVYYGAVTDPAGTYRIRGNVHGADYTSFTVETGAQDGHISKGVIATLNDTEFDVAADGSYEIIASPDPHPGNWLRLEPNAGSITTRHYWEWERSVAADPTFHVPLWIEPIERPGAGGPDGRCRDRRRGKARDQLRSRDDDRFSGSTAGSDAGLGFQRGESFLGIAARGKQYRDRIRGEGHRL